MRIYELRDYVPSWHPRWYFDPATNRQLKVLRFFGFPLDPPPTKGRASGLIWRCCSDPANKHLWLAYLYTTRDEDDSSTDLLPYDKVALARVVIPGDWQPKRNRQRNSDGATRSARNQAFDHIVADLLEHRSPFDDPLPELSIAGKHYCFTGQFEFGQRRKCQEAVEALGGSCTDTVTLETDVLVIGGKGSLAWAHGDYGNKIEAAVLARMKRGKPAIVPEAFWKELLRP